MNVSLWRDPNWKPPAPSGMEPRRSVFVASPPSLEPWQQLPPGAISVEDAELKAWLAAERGRSGSAMTPQPQASAAMTTPEGLVAAMWPEEQPQQPESGPVDALAAALWPEIYGQGDRD
jgi:hypothetical protein